MCFDDFFGVFLAGESTSIQATGKTLHGQPSSAVVREVINIFAASHQAQFSVGP